MRHDHSLDISRGQASRARAKALRDIEFLEVDQYKLMQAYAMEIKRSNPGSTVEFFALNYHFRGIYMCFQASKDGFKHCRPIIGLDGCWMKGSYPGHVLVAASIDANDGCYPIEFVVVDSECLETWDWFMSSLSRDIDTNDDRRWTFMSDHQKVVCSNILTLIFVSILILVPFLECLFLCLIACFYV